MAANYELWSVPDLKRELGHRHAVTTGRKLDLIERLKSYDRNKDFRGPTAIVPEPLDANWPVSGFQQLQQQHQGLLPSITQEQIDGYFLYRMADDREVVGDIKAIVKGSRMFSGNRVLACSVNQQSGIYFSGIVGASMKNKVTYNFKIKVEKTGEPVNSHCECPAGKGPHATCKHIASVLLMLQHFISTGTVQVEKSCTENLQMFHKPKSSYKGSPVKAQLIPSKRKWTDKLFEDPRPMKYRRMANYDDHVRNMMVNYCASSSRDLAIRYLYPKANIQAAAHDHDYFQVPFTEHWVDRAIQVTESSAKKIEKATQDQSRSHVWFSERKWRLTASRFGEVIKMTSRRNIAKLCESIVHRQTSTRAMIHGKQYEKKAISQFEISYHIKTMKSGFFVCSEMPFLGATPDAIVNKEYLVEVKCPYAGRFEKIEPGKHFPYLMYDPLGNVTLNTNSNYYYQIQGQMYIAERNYCYFVVYTFSDIFVQKISLDHDYCKYSMLPKLELFYTKHLRPYIASIM